MLRIAIYARVSTVDQDCSLQLMELRHYAEARRWTVIEEYVDHGVSGTKITRPAMDKLMEAARRREIDAIIVTKIDRWGRSMAHFVQTLQELRLIGVRFLAISQNIDTDEANPTARLLLNLLASFAEFERELIVERCKVGLARAKKEGRVLGRPKLVFDRARIAELRAKGKSIRQIAAEMGLTVTTVARALKKAA